jgi:hypothetical protein
MQVMVSLLPAAVFKALVVIIRTVNNVIGGISFVTCARIVGSQKTAPSEPEVPTLKIGKK